MHDAARTGEPRRITAAEAAALVRSGDWLDYGITLCQPDTFDRALAARRDELQGVQIRSCITMKPRAVLAADPEGRHFHWFSWHFSGYDRRHHDAGIGHYIPVNLGEIPGYYHRFLERPAIAVLKASPMDAEGYFSLGPTGGYHRAVVETARCLVLEVTSAMPPAHGDGNRVHRSEVDYLIEGDGTPMSEMPASPPTAVDRAVARLIAAEVEDGACLQVGIGGMPNAVCALLLDGGVRNLGVHSEMLNDGLVDLYRAGRVTGKAKAQDVGRITYSFALGGTALYETVRGNRDFECRPVDYTNVPEIIARNPRAIAINNTTQIDLQGQAASESDGHRHISGTGGQLQFVRGAYASEGGKSFICLASTYEKGGERRSRIVLNLTPGNVVTTPRSDMHYVVTEYGIANLKGRSVAERARAIIGLAHPDYREALEREAREKRLIPKFFI